MGTSQLAGCHEAAQAMRIAAHVARITRLFLGRANHNATRGRPRRVVCLSIRDDRGQPLGFESVTAAGRHVDRGADRIRRAIVRGGTCAGHQWAWADRGQLASPRQLPITSTTPLDAA